MGIMDSEIPVRTVVFRGTEPTELDLIEGRLELEGLRPLRLGRAYAALVGGGNSAFEQLITVPNEHVPAARSLLEFTATVDEAELERQALDADCIEEPWRPLQGNRGTPRQLPDPGGFAMPVAVGA